jgi:hypothetical protein
MAASGYTPISLYYSTTAAAAPTTGNLVNGELAINITDGKLYYKDGTPTVQAIAILSRTNGIFSDLTTAVQLAKGTTGQQPGSPVTGMIRYNTTTNQFEGYGGASPAWSTVGGGSTISNDTSTASNLYPLFAAATSGSATTIYTGNANLLYKPSTGELTSRVPVAGNGIFVNSQTVSTNYTIATGQSGISAGPITVSSGVAVTVSSGSRWVVS